MKYILSLVTALALFLQGCANFQSNVELVLGSPDQFGTRLEFVVEQIKPYLSTEAKGRLHQAGTWLVNDATGDLNALFALLPASTGSWTGDLAVANIKATLTVVVAKYGAHNATTFAYFKAAGNVLLTNFP